MFENLRANSKFWAPWKVTLKKFHTKNPQILGVIIKKLIRSGELAPDICAPLISKKWPTIRTEDY
jgi:hypothetical protein